MKRIISLISLVLFVFIALSLAQAEPVKLEYKFTKGEVDKYKMTMDMSMSGMSLDAKPINSKATMIFFQKTLAVFPDGSAKIQVSYNESKMSISKTKSQKIPSQKLVMIISKDGKVTGVQNIGKTAGSNPSLATILKQYKQYGVFPGKPMNLGESWSQALPLPYSDKSIDMNSTLISIDAKVGNLIAAKIKQVYQGNADIKQPEAAQKQGNNAEVIPPATMQMSIDGSNEVYFSPSLGKLLKSDGVSTIIIKQMASSDNTMQGNMNTSMKMHMTMTKIN